MNQVRNKATHRDCFTIHEERVVPTLVPMNAEGRVFEQLQIPADAAKFLHFENCNLVSEDKDGGVIREPFSMSVVDGQVRTSENIRMLTLAAIAWKFEGTDVPVLELLKDSTRRIENLTEQIGKYL